MQLEDGLWIAGGYYVDFDEHDQFRIIGPNNHLFCGLVDIPRHRITVSGVSTHDPGSVTVTVAGPVPALSGLPADQVIATVDASGKGPGTYTVDVIVRVPSGLTAQSVQPVRVTLTIRAR